MSGKVSDNLGRSSGLTKSATVTTQPKTVSASDPATDSNVSGAAVGDQWYNSSSGELFCITNVTTDGNIWYGQGGTLVAPILGNTGVFVGGNIGSVTNEMQQIQIDSTGNATDFGDLTTARAAHATGSGIRGIAGTGESTATTVLDYWTFASAGNATDFGDLTASAAGGAGVCNGARAVISHGNS